MRARLDSITSITISLTMRRTVSCTRRRPGRFGYSRMHLVELALHQRHLGCFFQRDQASADAVVDIVIVVGDLVGEIRQLRLQPGLLSPQKALAHVAQLARLGDRAVLENALAAFEGQIQAGNSA